MAQHFPTVAVFGLGTTGSHLVDLLARGGRQVIAVEADDTALRRGRGRVTATGDGVEFTTDPAHAVRAGLVIEALPERLEAKRGLFARLDADCPPHTVFATTTTGLSVTEIAFAAGRTDRTVGLHLFPLDPGREGAAVEVVGTPLTGAAVLADLGELIRDLGCLPVPVADRAGFIGGALTMAYLNDAVTMYERRYASRDSIDTAMTLGCGLPRGPLAHLDDMGLDTAHDTLEALYRRTGDPRYVPAPTLTHMVAAGLVGRKSGRGFYAYGAGGAAPDDARSDHTPSVPARPVHRIGVVGSGTMAVGIAEVCARSGRPTVLVARGELRAKEARAAVERSLERGVRRGKLAPEVPGASMDRLSTGCAMDALGACDLVIEAVAEDIDVKRAVFAALDAVCAPGAVLATSTSSLPVIECAMATGRPEDVVGMHFFKMLHHEASTVEGCVLFGYGVKDPERYGVGEMDEQGRLISLEEKPARPQSNLAITGFYLYDNDVVDIAKNVQPSARGELEITDVNRVYLERGKARLVSLGRGFAWLDTGTHDSLLQAGQYVQLLEQRQGVRIACLEEIAFRMGFIDATACHELGEQLSKTDYGQYLMDIAANHR